MRILKILTVTIILTMVVWLTTSQILNASEKNKNNFGYPDIEYKQQNTDRIVNVVNGVFVPPNPNRAGVAVLSPCAGIQSRNEGDIRELAQVFLDKGFTVAIPNYNTAPRPNKRPFNCGKNKNLSDMRLVKDVYVSVIKTFGTSEPLI
jgi:hypothetical protein